MKLHWEMVVGSGYHFERKHSWSILAFRWDFGLVEGRFSSLSVPIRITQHATKELDNSDGKLFKMQVQHVTPGTIPGSLEHLQRTGKAVQLQERKTVHIWNSVSWLSFMC